MKLINFSRDPFIDTVADALHKGAIIVHLNNVFAVVALPNKKGVDFLNLVKNRKHGKCYGSLISDTHEFVNNSILDSETKFRLTNCLEQGILDNSFIRIPWNNSGNPQLIMNGTHQGLKTTEPVLSFCHLIEQRLIQKNGGVMINSLICSSANISGDPRGSITDRALAIQFGKERGIDLFVEFDFPKNKVESGSFPIFSFNEMTFSIERKGPGCHEIESRLSKIGFSKIV